MTSGSDVAALSGAEWNPSQVEQVEGIGVERLVRQGEAEDVKSGQRVFRLERVERDVSRPHQVFHVHPGGVGAFGQRFGTLVDQVVEDLQTEIGDADIIDIGEDEGDFGLDFLPIFDNGSSVRRRRTGPVSVPLRESARGGIRSQQGKA